MNNNELNIDYTCTFVSHHVIWIPSLNTREGKHPFMRLWFNLTTNHLINDVLCDKEDFHRQGNTFSSTYCTSWTWRRQTHHDVSFVRQQYRQLDLNSITTSNSMLTQDNIPAPKNSCLIRIFTQTNDVSRIADWRRYSDVLVGFVIFAQFDLIIRVLLLLQNSLIWPINLS